MRNEIPAAFPPLPALGRKTRFRLGVTSYVYPADVLPNVRALAGKADDILLIFFESAPASLPPPDTFRALRDIARENRMTYTVHFPLDQEIGGPSAPARQALLNQILRITERARPLDPFAYILHVEGVQPADGPNRIAEWRRAAEPALANIARNLPPQLVCVENLGYPFEWCDPFLDRFGFSVCTDAGHLWERNYDWEDHVARYGARTRVIHLYGPAELSRHVSLGRAPVARTRAFLSAFQGFEGVLTLETFGYDDTRASIETLRECLGQP